MSTSPTPFINIGPGEFIQEELDERNWTQEDIADILGVSKKTVNELIRNKQSITREMSILLGKAFGQSPRYWMNLDNLYRLQMSRDEKQESEVEVRAEIYKYMPVNEMKKKGWLNASAADSSLAQEVKRFWGIDSLDLSFLDAPVLPALRKSDAFQQFNLYYTQIWFHMAQKMAREYAIGKFRKNALENLTADFHRFTTRDTGISDCIHALNDIGVKFFVLSHMAKTYTDGATFYDHGNPVIVYTNRYDRSDHFWFTVAHEIAHILLHLKPGNDVIIDQPELREQAAEKQANGFAEKMLRKDEVIGYFKRHGGKYIRKTDIIACSVMNGVGEGVVVGLLQHEGILAKSSLNSFKAPVSVHIPEDRFPERSLAHP